MALIEHRNSGRYHPPKSEQDKARAGMSVEGQKRRFDNLPVTSGLPPTSDMSLHRTEWREVHNSVRGALAVINPLLKAFLRIGLSNALW
jgi:hypothetical protein